MSSVATAGDVKAQAEDDLVRTQDALTVAEETKRKVEAETAHLRVEWTVDHYPIHGPARLPFKWKENVG